MSITPNHPFVRRKNREAITREVDPAGKWSTQFPEMLGYRSQGGGKVPADLAWETNPKQEQEELTEAQLRRELKAKDLEAALPAGLHTPAPKP